MQPQTPTIEPNTLVHGRYTVARTIGRGGMGAVYEATDQRLGHTVALKQMLVSGANVAAAFEREARILAGLRHPALPRVSDFFSDGQGQFLVMEFIPGTDLGTLLGQRGRPFPVEEVLRWADQALDVLQYLHVQNPPIVHRDIKPQNIKLTPAGDIVLLDFGLAKGYAAAQATTGSLFGYTPNYAPLEQVQGTGTNPASDMYALAATLHHLLTGAPPPDVLQRLGAAASGQPDPLRPAHDLNPLVPAAVGQWLIQGLQLDQARRPASAAAMRATLRQLHQPPVSAPVAASIGTTLVATAPTPAAAQPVAPATDRRNVFPLLLGGLVFLALIASLAFFVALRQNEQVAVVLPPLPETQAVAATLPASVVPAEPSTKPEPSSTALPSPTPLPTFTALPTSPPATLGPIAAQAGSGPVFGPSGPQRPAQVSASGEAPPGVDAAGNRTTFGAANLSDGRSDTAWRVPGDGLGQFVLLDMGRPVRVSQVQLIPGYAKIDPTDGTDRFLQNRRVRRVRLEFSDGSSVEATFSDTPALQAVGLPQPILTTWVRIVITETTPLAPNGRDFTPISEVVVVGEAQLP